MSRLLGSLGWPPPPAYAVVGEPGAATGEAAGALAGVGEAEGGVVAEVAAVGPASGVADLIAAV